MQMELFHAPLKETYDFVESMNKNGISDRLSRYNSTTVTLWNKIRKQGWTYYGVVGDRKWSAIFEKNGIYLTLHHFVDEEPNLELKGEKSPLQWKDLSGIDERMATPNELFKVLEDVFQMRSFIPTQAFTDALLENVCTGQNHWRLNSPKHKLMVWFEKDEYSLFEQRHDLSLLVEVFFGFPFPPYGVKEALEIPTDIKARNIRNSSKIHRPAEDSMFAEPPMLEDRIADDVMDSTMAAIKKAFVENDYVMVASSFGKDSSTINQLTIEFLLKNPEYQDKFLIVSADTMVENPIMEAHVQNMKKAIVEYLDEHFINGFDESRFMLVQPEVENTFTVTMLGKGYAPPSTLFKWCVPRIKITPADEALTAFLEKAKHEGRTKVVQILGVRDSESSTREKSIKKHFGDDFYSQHKKFEGIVTCAPIRHWTVKEIATYLVNYPAPWNKTYSNRNIINIYGEAAGGVMECPIGAMIESEDSAVKSCSGGGSRFGCWSCTVINDDSSMKNLVELYPELEPYYKLRQYMKLIQDMRYGTRTGYQRLNKKHPTLGSGSGDLTMDSRTFLLEKWVELGVPMREKEVMAIDRMVQEREYNEGYAVTRRFLNALYKLYPVHPVFTGSMYHPIWEPAFLIEPKSGAKIKQDTTGVDKCTTEDIALFRRLDNFKKRAESLEPGQVITVKIKANKLQKELPEKINRNNFWINGAFKEMQQFKYVLTNAEVFNHPELVEEMITISFFDIERVELVAAKSERKAM